MDSPVNGKYALITGGGSGINLAFAKLLLSKGCSVLLADLHCRPEAQAVLDQYPRKESASSSSSSSAAKSTPFALFHKTDVVSWPQIASMWSAALDAFPTVDIVVPGAGLFEPPYSSFWHAPRTATNPETPSRDDADADRGHYAVLDVNLVSPIRLSQLAISHWTAGKQAGCLVHVGSVAGFTSAINTPLYFASKHGLHGFVRSLGALRDKMGIRVGCVAPSAVRTPLWSDDPSKASMMDKVVFLEPEEVAEAMYELVVNEEFGDGTIYEVRKGSKRVVPQYNNPPPPPEGREQIMGFIEAQKGIYANLENGGFKV